MATLRMRRLGSVDLDAVTDELYALHPGEFVAVRDQRAAAAKADGDAGLSASIRKLRKPTTSAWLANQLVRQRRDDISRLMDLGSRLRAAQRQLAGNELRELSRQRHEVLAALGTQARDVGRRAGVAVPDAVADELHATLAAAVADQSAGEALCAGRLTAALQYAGTGLGDPALFSDPATPAPTFSSEENEAAKGKPRRPGTKGREAARRGSVQEARRATSEAKAASRRAISAKKKAAEAKRQLSEVHRSFERAKAEVERLARREAELRQRADAAGQELQEAVEAERTARRGLKGPQGTG